MRLYEDNYSVDNIIDDINEELGFSFVKDSDEEGTGYFVLGQDIKLYVDFIGDIEMNLDFPESAVEFSEGKSRAEELISALESSIEIYDIVKRMTSGYTE